MKNRIYNKIIAFFLLPMLMLVGCSAPLAVSMDEGASVLKTDKKDVGYVYIYREAEFLASARGIYIAANGKRVGALNSGTYFIYEAKPGNLVLAAENSLEKPVTRTLTISPGKKYFIQGSFKSGFWDVIPNLTIMNNNEGESAIQSLKYSILK